MIKKSNNNPYALRLGELKLPLQIEACEQDRSLQWVIKRILRTHVENTVKEKKPVSK